MPTPEQRDEGRPCDWEPEEHDPIMVAAIKRLTDEVQRLKREEREKAINAVSEQCTCTALFTNALCPIHGPAFTRHLENRK